VDHEIDVCLPRGGRRAMLQRNFVRAKERRNDAEWEFGAKACDDTERFELVVERETVAGLHFDGRRAKCRKPLETPACEVEQVILGARAQITDGRMNAAAAPRDLHVVESRGAHLLFFVARTAEDRVCV